MDVYEKTAFFATAARMAARAAAPAAAEAGAVAAKVTKPSLIGNVGKGVMNFGKGLFFMDANKGAGVVGKGLNMAGKGVSTLGPIASSMGTNMGNGPAASVAGMEFKTGSVDERLLNLTKVAFGIADAADVAAYGLMGASKFIPKESPWHTGTEGAGLALLAATTGKAMFADPGERKPGIKDMIGLALFASALHDRYKNHAVGGGAVGH